MDISDYWNATRLGRKGKNESCDVAGLEGYLGKKELNAGGSATESRRAIFGKVPITEFFIFLERVGPCLFIVNFLFVGEEYIEEHTQFKRGRHGRVKDYVCSLKKLCN